MVAEVEAMRRGVEDERKRLLERCAMLTKEAQEKDAAARAEADRLAQQVQRILFSGG